MGINVDGFDLVKECECLKVRVDLLELFVKTIIEENKNLINEEKLKEITHKYISHLSNYVGKNT